MIRRKLFCWGCGSLDHLLSDRKCIPTLGQIRTNMFRLADDLMIDRDSVEAWAQNVRFTYITSFKDDDTSPQDTDYVTNQLEEAMLPYIFHLIAVTLFRFTLYTIIHLLPTRSAMCPLFESNSGCTVRTIWSPSRTNKF